MSVMTQEQVEALIEKSVPTLVAAADRWILGKALSQVYTCAYLAGQDFHPEARAAHAAEAVRSFKSVLPEAKPELSEPKA